MIIFNPTVGLLVLAALIAVSLAVAGLGVYTHARGTGLRVLGLALLVGLLAGPEYMRETLRPLPDIMLVAVDQSQSMQIGGRAAMATAALQNILNQAEKLPNLVVRQVAVPPADDGGTALFAALQPALADIPQAQLAGVVAISDGEVADAPPHLPFAAPMTALLAAKGEETDRELRLLSAPQYGLVGKDVTLKLEVFDHGVCCSPAPAEVSVTEDGQVIWRGNANAGQAFSVDVPVHHAGRQVVTAQVQGLAGEVSAVNDQVAFALNGINKKLDVLLISGNPNQSERAWRLLLKSDPAVALVHFTILRNPQESLDAPPQDVALVPFPVEQLFNTDIDKFNLIILDEFDSAGLLPPQYLQNIADYVKRGGALLVQAGPEFEGPNSLANSALAQVLPVVPAPPGTVTQNFNPLVTSLGARHPVTAPFAGKILAPWERLEAVDANTGDVLMTGGDENWPLLVLAAAQSGRVGMLLSDQFWLWTRGGAHDGPALPLLRRVVHWLLREPALEPEFLAAQIQHGQLAVTRQSLSDQPPGDVSVTGPDGAHILMALQRTAPGVYAGNASATLPGVWQVSQGAMTAYAINPLGNAREYQNLAASAQPLQNMAHIIWLGRQDVPDIAAMIKPRHAQQITGTRDEPLLPPVPAMILVLALLAGAWWRERG